MPKPRSNNKGYDELSSGDYATSMIGSGVAGTAAGAEAGGTWGAVGGGILGILEGYASADVANQDYIAAQEQQAALNRELKNVGGNIDLYMQDRAMANALDRERSQVQARQQAARLGLTPAQSAQLQEQIEFDRRIQAQAGRGEDIRAGLAAKEARRAGILNEYQVAQKLANEASASKELDDIFGSIYGLAGSIGGSGIGGEAKGKSTSNVSGDKTAAAATDVAKQLELSSTDKSADIIAPSAEVVAPETTPETTESPSLEIDEEGLKQWAAALDDLDNTQKVDTSEQVANVAAVGPKESVPEGTVTKQTTAKTYMSPEPVQQEAEARASSPVGQSLMQGVGAYTTKNTLFDGVMEQAAKAGALRASNNILAMEPGSKEEQAAIEELFQTSPVYGPSGETARKLGAVEMYKREQLGESEQEEEEEDPYGYSQVFSNE